MQKILGSKWPLTLKNSSYAVGSNPPGRVAKGRLVLHDSQDEEWFAILVWTEDSEDLNVPQPDVGYLGHPLEPGQVERLIRKTGPLPIRSSQVQPK